MERKDNRDFQRGRKKGIDFSEPPPWERETDWEKMPFPVKLRILKKDFQRNVLPAVKRHSSAKTKGQRRREARLKSIARIKKKIDKMRERER